MPSINPLWWEHLAPKPMHNRLREIDALLQNWFLTDYGAHWLSVASNEHGLMRVRPGQVIPVVHLISLPGRPIYIAPYENLAPSHWMVGRRDDLSKGPLADDELAITPLIRIDVAEDAALLAAAARGEFSAHVEGVQTPSLVFSAPAHLLLAPKFWPKKSFVLYQHIFGAGGSYPNDGYFYVGVTTRSWQARWAEHRRAMEGASPLLFHRKLREELEAGRVTYIHHKVMGVTDDIEALYATEEMLVEGHWADERRLNMIPGGKSGLRYLRENGLLAKGDVPLPDERDRIVETWLRDHPRRGLPAPWVAEKWKDDAWAVAQICGRDGRLSVDQVRAIRELAEAHSAEQIAERIGARTVDQVRRVLDGKTYTRVT